MKKYLLFVLIFTWFCTLYSQKAFNIISEELKFEKINPSENTLPAGWGVYNGQAELDPINVFEGNYSLKMYPFPSVAKKVAQVYYLLEMKKIVGDTLSIKGHYKYENFEDASITFTLQYWKPDSKELMLDTLHLSLQKGNHNWTEFTLKLPFDTKNMQTPLFGILSIGEITTWLDNIDLLIDNVPIRNIEPIIYKAEKDHEFDNGSGISLAKLNTVQLENMEILCRLWGFLKYYHPVIRKGEVNWDYELFRVMPDIVKAGSKETRNKLLYSWLEKYGTTFEMTDYTISDPSQYSQLTPLNWINNTEWFDGNTVTLLNNIKNAVRDNFSYYVENNQGIISFNNNENFYPSIRWNDQGYRILTFFRLWNAIEYYFPYRDIADKSWDTVLKDYLPLIIDPRDRKSYELALLSLMTSIDDSHGHLSYVDNWLSAHYNSPIGKTLYLPVETENVTDQYVVKRSMFCNIRPGDIIISIDGKTMQQMEEEYRHQIPASNDGGMKRNLSRSLISSREKFMNLTLLRDNDTVNLVYNTQITKAKDITRCPDDTHTVESYSLPEKNILYLDCGTVPTDSMMYLINRHMDSKGIIFDLRKYKTIGIYELGKLLIPTSRPFVLFSENMPTLPGNHIFLDSTILYSDNPDYYKGKVAILVDRNTQSHMEFVAMALRTAPNSAVIGSTTAGADGNIARLPLPGNMIAIFTGLGTYYPDKSLCQRKGIKIDIEALPTVTSLKEGRDVHIEKAIEYITR